MWSMMEGKRKEDSEDFSEWISSSFAISQTQEHPHHGEVPFQIHDWHSAGSGRAAADTSRRIRDRWEQSWGWAWVISVQHKGLINIPWSSRWDPAHWCHWGAFLPLLSLRFWHHESFCLVLPFVLSVPFSLSSPFLFSFLAFCSLL